MPTSTSTPVPCGTPPAVEVTAFDLNSLSWEALEIDDQPVRQLLVPTFLPYPISISPDNRWLATAFENIGGEAAIALIDTREEAHWWVNTRAYQVANANSLFEQWLPNGELVWLDETGRVFVGDQQNHRAWETPVSMFGIKVASDNIAFARDREGNLWRLDLASGQWEEITTIQPPKVGTLGGYYSIARDGSYAFSFQGGQHGEQMWRIPAVIGQDAEPLPDVEMSLDILGSGAPLPLPQQLANTSYWLISLPIVLAGSPASGIIAGGIVVDTRDGSVLSAGNLGLSDELYLTGFTLSLDGEWISMTLTDRESRQVVGLYLAPANELTAGRIIDSSNLSVVGWHTDPPTVIFRNESARTHSVAPLPLTDESPGNPLEGAGELLATAAGSIIATAADNSALVLQFDLEGNLLNALDLSSQYESVQVAQGTAGRIYLAAMGRQRQENSTCSYGVVEWLSGLGS